MKLKLPVSLFLAVLLLSGCAAVSGPQSTEQTADTGTAQGENSDPDADSADSSETESQEQEADPAFVLERYSQIATRSCQAALERGVIEQSSDGLIKLIMVPKDQGYLGYSAVYIEQFGDQTSDKFVELLYDASYFSSCTDFFDMELAREAGAELDFFEIKENLANAIYQVTREFEGELYTMSYEVIGGVIASSERVIQGSIKLNITYGTTEVEIALLTEAVEGYLLTE